MKCQDILQNELHEKHILDQLDGSEKEKYELHLKECENCQAELENQRILISGIREAGLAEMKNEIKRQVEIGELNHPGMAWGRLSKIAAVLFIFVLTPGVIIYLSKNNPELVPTAEQKTENAPEDISYSVADAATERRLNIMSTEMMDADSRVLKIPKQKDAAGNKVFKKDESPKLNAFKPAFEENKKAKIITEMDKQEMPIRAEPAQSKIALNEEASTFKDEKEEVILKSKLAAAPQESQPAHQIDPIIIDALKEAKTKKMAFSSSVYRGARTYVYETPEAGLKKTGQSRLRNTLLRIKTTGQMDPDLRFTSNGHTVLVHLKATTDEQAKEVLGQTFDVQLSKSFAVEVIKQDSLIIEMNWLVESKFLKVKSDEIKIVILDDQLMRVIIENKYIYETELSKKTSTAILKE